MTRMVISEPPWRASRRPVQCCARTLDADRDVFQLRQGRRNHHGLGRCSRRSRSATRPGSRAHHDDLQSVVTPQLVELADIPRTAVWFAAGEPPVIVTPDAHRRQGSCDPDAFAKPANGDPRGSRSSARARNARVSGGAARRAGLTSDVSLRIRRQPLQYMRRASVFPRSRGKVSETFSRRPDCGAHVSTDCPGAARNTGGRPLWSAHARRRRTHWRVRSLRSLMRLRCLPSWSARAHSRSLRRSITTGACLPCESTTAEIRSSGMVWVVQGRPHSRLRPENVTVAELIARSRQDFGSNLRRWQAFLRDVCSPVSAEVSTIPARSSTGCAHLSVQAHIRNDAAAVDRARQLVGAGTTMPAASSVT